MRDPADTSSAKHVLREVMGYYGRELTTLESVGWLKLIAEFGDEPIVRFLAAHMERSAFAPKLSEALDALRPNTNSAQGAFEELHRAVQQRGPYRVPTFTSQAIAGAVLLLGGWTKVCELMPDPASRFDYEAFFKRFEVCYRQAAAQLMLKPQDVPRLRSLHEMRPALEAPTVAEPERLQ